MAALAVLLEDRADVLVVADLGGQGVLVGGLVGGVTAGDGEVSSKLARARSRAAVIGRASRVVGERLRRRCRQVRLDTDRARVVKVSGPEPRSSDGRSGNGRHQRQWLMV